MCNLSDFSNWERPSGNGSPREGGQKRGRWCIACINCVLVYFFDRDNDRSKRPVKHFLHLRPTFPLRPLTAHKITGYSDENGNIVDSYVRFLSGYEKYKWMNDTVLFGKGKALSENTYEVDYYYYK